MELLSLDTLCSLVREVRPIIFDRGLAANIKVKGVSDFVTQADTTIQSFIRERLTELCPECRFMGEEGSQHDIDMCVPTFVLDPIDGTTNFIHDMQLSAVSLALTLGGETLKAVVYNPFTNEMFSAEKGKGAYLNGNPIHVSAAPDLSHALVGIGTMPYEKDISSGYFELYRQLFLRSEDIRRIGSAALDACYVAVGRIDCYLENGLHLWDFAATRLIIAEAGGVLTDWSGNPLRTDITSQTCEVAFSNGKFHDEFIGIIKKYRGNTVE